MPSVTDFLGHLGEAKTSWKHITDILPTFKWIWLTTITNAYLNIQPMQSNILIYLESCHSNIHSTFWSPPTQEGNIWLFFLFVHQLDANFVCLASMIEWVIWAFHWKQQPPGGWKRCWWEQWEWAKTMSWTMLKHSIELMGTAESWLSLQATPFTYE